MEVYNWYDCLGFVAVGIFIGYLLCHAKYQVAAAVAMRMSGKEDKPRESWMDRTDRSIVITVIMVVSMLLVIVITCWCGSYLNDDWYQKNGYIYVNDTGGKNNGKWVYKTNLPAEKPIAK
jgi:hypothetical protein